METKENVIIDCDPGLDDAIALFLAMKLPGISVSAVTTVAGNTSLRHTTQNALNILELAGSTKIPVAAGMSHAMLDPFFEPGTFHGENGIGGMELPKAPSVPVPLHGVDFLVQLIDHAADPVTLITLGPLTNVAMALSKQPSITRNLKRIVAMGGAVAVPGNVSGTAEFNIWADPHAASYVLRSGVPLVLVPLNATLNARTSVSQIEALRAISAPVGPIVGSILGGYLETYRAQYGYTSVPIHDALAVAVAADPTLVTLREMSVRVVTDDGWCRGQTVADWWGTTGERSNAMVALDVDNERFQRLLYETIATYEK